MEPSETDLRAAIAANPSDIESARMLAILCVKSRKFAEGTAGLSRVLRLRPQDFDALIWFAVGKKGLREFDQAIAASRKAIALRPKAAIGYHTLGQCFLANRQAAPAVEALERAVALDPTMAPAFHSLGNAFLLLDRGREATEAFRRVTEVAPGDVHGYLSLSEQLIKHSDPASAVECLERARRHFPNSPTVLMKLARAYSLAGNAAQAEKLYLRAVSHDPSASAAYGMWLQEEARPEESAAAFRKSIEVQPLQGFAFFGLVQAKPDSVGPELRRAMRELSTDSRLHLMEKMYLAYAEGRLEEREKHYEQAMSSFDLANDLAYKVHNEGRAFDRESQKMLREQTMADFASPLHQVASSESEKPILIVGMIRSGTTLLDQMLSAHPDVASAGELRFWIENGARRMGREHLGTDLTGDYLRELERWGGGAARVTDKMPLNYTHLGLIHRSFPNARLVHIRRNPVDTCLSIYMTYLGASPYFAYRRENIVFYYREYLRQMEFWRKSLPADRLIEIDYETLATEPAPVVERLLDFCGLPWDSACIHPEQNRAAIRTPSLWQARGPIVRSSVEKWRRYEPWLREFGELLSP